MKLISKETSAFLVNGTNIELSVHLFLELFSSSSVFFLLLVKNLVFCSIQSFKVKNLKHLIILLSGTNKRLDVGNEFKMAHEPRVKDGLVY